MSGQRVCPNCGKSATDGDAFCRACGWHLAGESRALVITPRRELVPYRLDRALLIGSATTFALSAAWLGVRWLTPRVAATIARRLAAVAPEKPPQKLPEAAATPEHVETIVWLRQVIWRRH